MPKDNQPAKEQIKVTDKRIFTADGQIREEFRNEIKPADPVAAPPTEAKPPAAEPGKKEAPKEASAETADRRRSVGDRAPSTPFTHFIESLIMQAYMSLGMLRNPYQPQVKVDAAAARQMIDILSLLQEKTAGNLTPDEDEFLSAHVAELKLAYVQRTKNI